MMVCLLLGSVSGQQQQQQQQQQQVAHVGFKYQEEFAIQCIDENHRWGAGPVCKEVRFFFFFFFFFFLDRSVFGLVFGVDTGGVVGSAPASLSAWHWIWDKVNCL